MLVKIISFYAVESELCTPKRFRKKTRSKHTHHHQQHHAVTTTGMTFEGATTQLLHLACICE